MSDSPAKPGFDAGCPTPLRHSTIQLAHGGGGRLMRELIEHVFLPDFGPSHPRELHDSALVEAPGGKLAFTTDAFVVSPLEFPGGDIGKLAVFGTLNDLAMAGAEPRYLSASFILEEGFAIETLRRIVASMAEVSRAANVRIVTGDTKVVDRGRGDGVYITTAGVGIPWGGAEIAPSRIRVGDAVIVSGDLGRHGMAVFAKRQGLELEGLPESDCGNLWPLVRELLARDIEVHCLRDLTRGGLATALCELAESSDADVDLDETMVPVDPAVAGACELLGFDPLYVANEGRLVLMLPAGEAPRALEALHSHPLGRGAAAVGRIAPRRGSRPLVSAQTALGGQRVLDLLTGDQLPRIC